MHTPMYLLIYRIKKRFQKCLKFLLERTKKNHLARCNEKQPIIVLGNQKTGSTAIASLLSRASGKSVTLDIIRAIPDVNWQLGITHRVQSFQDFVWKYRYEFSNEIIKEPSLTFFYPELLETFPIAKFVFIQRDPFQNIRSILDRLRVPGDLECIDFDEHEELKRYPIWRLALNSQWLGRECSSYIEALAHRWDVAAGIYLRNHQRFHLVRYEDFLSDKRGIIEKLCNELGLSIVQNIGKNVHEQHQPKGRSNVDLKVFFGEKNYAIIESICYENGKKLGYF